MVNKKGLSRLRLWGLTFTAILLMLLMAAPAAVADWSSFGARDSLLEMAEQYRTLLDRHDPGSPYVATLEQLSDNIATMTDDENHLATVALGPVLAGMQHNLDSLTALLEQREAEMQISWLVTQSIGFPSANYPDVDIPGTAIELVNTLPDFPSMLSSAFRLAMGWDTVEDYYPPGFTGALIPGVCKGDPDGDGIANRTSDSFLISSQAILNSLDFGREIAGRICDQDLTIVGEGGNLSIACIAADVIYLIPKYLLDQVLMCESAIDTSELEGAYRRIGHVHEDLDVMSADMGTYYSDIMTELLSIEAQLAQQEAMLEVVLDNQDEIIRLINTPSGQRPEWPNKSSFLFKR